MQKNCINLTNGLRVHTDGSYTPCCLSIPTRLKDEDGRIMKVNTDSIEDALNSPTLVKLREETAKGLQPEACSICWSVEDAGFESKRIQDNRKIKSIDNSLLMLELNLGNICNLACRSCNIDASANWKKEHNLVVDPKYKLTSEQLDSLASKYSTPFSDTSPIWDQLKTHIKYVKYLDLYGGEPMLMKKQWEILKYSVDKGYSKHQYVHFNTNGTIFKQAHVDLLKNFHTVDISFSIDGKDNKFNYIRHLGNWDKVEDNIDGWLNSTRKYTNFKYNICYTVSILNVLDFFELAHWSKKRDIRIHVNMIHHPPYYNITNIPEELKPIVTKYIVDSIETLDGESHSQGMNIVNFMNNTKCNAESWNKFLRINKILDKSRNQSFENTFPELNKIIKENYVQKHI